MEVEPVHPQVNSPEFKPIPLYLEKNINQFTTNFYYGRQITHARTGSADQGNSRQAQSGKETEKNLPAGRVR